MNEGPANGDVARPAAFTRRVVLAAAGAGALAAGLTDRSGVARQQEALPEVVVAFLAAWVALDADGIAETYADDGVREDITAPDLIQGREAVRRSLVDFIGAFEHAKVEHPVAFAAADHFAADTWVFTADYTGALPGLPPGQGEPVTIHGFTLIEITDGSISRTVDYYDAYGLLVQVGGAPPQGDDPNPASPVD